ncbi:MAG: hypothetical protein GEU99_24195 [Luteitalea sp.]|nr:hypothetical protein [Luteitalea sp.]
MRYNGRDVSIHGKYRFQVRGSFDRNPKRTVPVGVESLRLEVYFENGIMSIPQIFSGENRVHVKVADASRVEVPIEVIYKYETEAGEEEHRQVLRAADFENNVATYGLSARGLKRCNAVIVDYR